MRTIFSVAVFSHSHTHRHCSVWAWANTCALTRAYAHTGTAWHASPLSRCAELGRTAGIQSGLMNSMSARGRERKIGKTEAGAILQSLCYTYKQYRYTEGLVNRHFQPLSIEWLVSFAFRRANSSFFLLWNSFSRSLLLPYKNGSEYGSCFKVMQSA